MSGKFIVLDGIDGSGKSTQITTLAQRLFTFDKNIDVLMTREPTRRTQQLRETMAKPQDPSEHLQFYTRFFIQDRKSHLAETIEPALYSGTHVICDRYKYSTLAYQTAQGGDFDQLLAAHQYMRVPDLVLILDLDPEIAKTRVQGEEVFDTAGLEFQIKLRENYLRTLELNEPVILIDASQSPEVISEQIWAEVVQLFQ